MVTSAVRAGVIEMVASHGKPFANMFHSLLKAASLMVTVLFGLLHPNMYGSTQNIGHLIDNLSKVPPLWKFLAKKMEVPSNVLICQERCNPIQPPQLTSSSSTNMRNSEAIIKSQSLRSSLHVFHCPALVAGQQVECLLPLPSFLTTTYGRTVADVISFQLPLRHHMKQTQGLEPFTWRLFTWAQSSVHGDHVWCQSDLHHLFHEAQGHLGFPMGFPQKRWVLFSWQQIKMDQTYII